MNERETPQWKDSANWIRWTGYGNFNPEIMLSLGISVSIGCILVFGTLILIGLIFG